MRIHNFFIALIVVSLFAVVLSSTTKELFSGGEENDGGLGIDYANYTHDESSQNASNILAELSILTTTEKTTADIVSNAPSGSDSNVPSSSETDVEGLMQQSGISFVTKVGKFMFSVPKVIIESILSYFNIDPAFGVAAVAIFFFVIGVMLVSSILRNRI